jgi:hypothetical protein
MSHSLAGRRFAERSAVAVELVDDLELLERALHAARGVVGLERSEGVLGVLQRAEHPAAVHL